MKSHGFPSRVAFKGSLVLLLVMLALQGFGVNGLAAPAALSHDFQEGESPGALTCGCLSTHIQILFLIDDSGSMRAAHGLWTPRAERMFNGLAAQTDVQVGVIHFSGGVKENSGWIQIDPGGNWQARLSAEIGWINHDKALQTTRFVEPFEAAYRLFESAEADCALRRILLFSDGIPEDGRGPISGQELKDEMAAVTSTAGQLRDLNVVIKFSGPQGDRRAWERVKAYWSGILGEESASQIERLNREQLASRMEEITASLREIKQGENPTGSSKFQELILKFEPEPVRLQQGQSSDLKFKLVDRAGKVVLPGPDSAYPVRLSGSVTQAGQEIPWIQEGDSYRFTWTPERSGNYQFRVAAKLEDASGKKLLDCSGSLALQVDPAPDPVPPVILSLVIGPADEPLNNSVTLPMQLTYVGDNANAPALEWKVSATADPGGRVLNAVVNPDNTTPGKFNLRIDPIDDARQIKAHIAAGATMNGTLIDILDTTTAIKISPPPEPVCGCAGGWEYWFWPLAIFLAGLLVILLVLRFRREPAEDHNQEEWEYLSWRRYRRLVFLPALLLLVFLVLNRLWWCCVIPVWLFLALILVLVISPVPLAFLPRNIFARRRIWWLVALLLLVLLTWYFFRGNDLPGKYLPALWLSLFSIWLIRLYIIPIPTPVPPPPAPPGPEPKPDESRPEPEIPDDLTLIEGIGPQAAAFLYQEGITTFKKLAETDVDRIVALVERHGWENIMVPETWPKQARLADLARESGNKIDQDIFEDYLYLLKGGRIRGKSGKHAPNNPGHRNKGDDDKPRDKGK